MINIPTSQWPRTASGVAAVWWPSPATTSQNCVGGGSVADGGRGRVKNNTFPGAKAALGGRHEGRVKTVSGGYTTPTNSGKLLLAPPQHKEIHFIYLFPSPIHDQRGTRACRDTCDVRDVGWRRRCRPGSDPVVLFIVGGFLPAGFVVVAVVGGGRAGAQSGRGREMVGIPPAFSMNVPWVRPRSPQAKEKEGK